MEEALNLFRKISANIKNVTAGKMFGAECFKASNGKAIAFYYKSRIVCKLTGEPLKEALSMDGTQVFQPTGRPMGGWIEIPYDYKDEWESYAQQAMIYVNSLPPNAKKKSK